MTMGRSIVRPEASLAMRRLTNKVGDFFFKDLERLAFTTDDTPGTSMGKGVCRTGSREAFCVFEGV